MNYGEAYSCLGIPVTKDVAQIKKAYQGKLPDHHPEDDPEGFMHLHQAYKTAMAYAQKNGNIQAQLVDYTRNTEYVASGREETGYDSLFARLEENTAAVDISREKKRFVRMILRLKLRWLPISPGSWQKFFASSTYQLCRGDEECLERLFDLVFRKCHSYRGLRVILGSLWELEAWLAAEGKDVLAARVQGWIGELRRDYSHYLELDSNRLVAGRLYPAVWYYVALPFLLRMTVSAFLLPLLTVGIDGLLLVWMAAFYIGEFSIFHIKKARQMGFFHSGVRKKQGKGKKWDKTGLMVVGSIYAVLFHIAGCITFMENVWG